MVLVPADRSDWLALTPHPLTPCVALQGLQASLARSGAGARVSFRFSGRIGKLRVPSPAPPQRVDELWRHLCAELFVMMPDGGYLEFNFSPSGSWAAYRFDDYRSGMRPAALPADPVVTCRGDDDVLELDVALTFPPALANGAPLRGALCAMVEEADGALSCWAMRHAGGKPDFHHAGSFALLAE